MKIIAESINFNEIEVMAGNFFGDMVKAVVDVERELLAMDAELHADLEKLLIENGSKQAGLWGINFYPKLEEAQWVEFDSMINMRPSQGNRSRGVENEAVRNQILTVVKKRVKR